jgi:hypothetical protein
MKPTKSHKQRKSNRFCNPCDDIKTVAVRFH